MSKFIFEYIEKHIRKFLLFLGLSIIVLSIGLIAPYLESKAIDKLVYEPSKNFLFSIVFVIILLNILSTVLSYIQNLVSVQLKNKISFEILNDILRHLKKVEILNLSNYDSAYLSSRISSDSDTVISFLLSNVIKAGSGLLTIVFCSVWLLCFYGAEILAIIFGVLPLYIMVYIVLKKPLYLKRLNLLENQGIFFSVLNRTLKNIKTIKAKVLFEKSDNECQNSFSSLLESIVSFNKISYIFSSMNSICTTILRILILLITGLRIIEGTLTIGEFTLISSYCNMIISVVTYYLSLGESYQNAKVSFLRIKEFYEMKLEDNGEKQLDLVNRIDIKNLCFGYNKQSNVIENFSYTFHKGKIYAIVGSNGAGKTTLLDLLLGIINTNLSGDIFYEDSNIKELDMYHIRKKLVAYVAQEPYLSVDTIQNNLTANIKNVNLKTLDMLLEKFELKEKIESLDEKDKTIINDNIKNLSGGERQKIALINAILSDSQVLVLDEPTSALDSTTIDSLKNILLQIKQEKIILLISHDKNFYTIADEQIPL